MSREGLGVCLPWRYFIVCLACVLALCLDVVDCMILPPINWNASNPMFKTSNNDHVIQVNMFDELDFICPQFSEWDDSENFEYYIIYQVSKREYDDCNIYPESSAIMIVNCSSPHQRKRFTLLFEPFASIPHVPEFKYGSAYYYISTSTGTRDGITNSQQGACFYRNMKLTIKVCCETTTTSTTTTTTPAPTTTTTRVTPRRHHRTTPRPNTHRTKSTTDSNNIKYTDNMDKTSTKPDKEKIPPSSDENNVNKHDDEEGQNDNPKKEGLVNSAQTLVLPSVANVCSTMLMSFWCVLPWLHR